MLRRRPRTVRQSITMKTVVSCHPPQFDFQNSNAWLGGRQGCFALRFPNSELRSQRLERRRTHTTIFAIVLSGCPLWVDTVEKRFCGPECATLIQNRGRVRNFDSNSLLFGFHCCVWADR